MLTPSEQAMLNVEEARALRAAGCSYRQIGRQLKLSTGQLGHVRRVLKREKAGRTRLRRTTPDATDRELPVMQSALPPGLRRQLKAAGHVTLGDVADRLNDPDLAGLETMAGIGPYKAGLVKRLLDHHGLLAGSDDLRSAVERLFPDFVDPPAGRP